MCALPREDDKPKTRYPHDSVGNEIGREDVYDTFWWHIVYFAVILLYIALFAGDLVMFLKITKKSFPREEAQISIRWIERLN